MNHYPHHIGDFDRATRHLTRIERSIYRDLMDIYYDTESRLTLDQNVLCRKILARSNEEVTAVKQVLNEFFNETPTGWYHVRCEEEIESYRANNTQKALAGKASAAARALKKQLAINGASTPVEQVLNVEPTTGEHPHNGTQTNQEPEPEPETKKEKSKTSALATRLPSDWVPSDSEIQFCKRERPDLDPQSVADCFRDHWIAQPGAKGKKADWFATWRNWVRNQWKQGAPPGRPAKFDPTEYVNQGRKTGVGNEQCIDGESQRVA